MKRFISTLLMFLVSSISLMATHMMGADMSYQCLGGGKYKIIAKVYRDCKGIPFNDPTTGAMASGCSSASLPMTRTRIRDITPVCASASNPCNPTNTTSGEGVEEHTYETTIDLTQNPWSNFKANNCCEITFYAGQCCRNGAITTGQSNQDFMTSCMLNICEIGNKCNSSPNLSNEPVAYLCCNQPFYFNNGAIDTADYDSLAYSLVSGMTSLTNPVSYGSGFSPTVPMTPFCPQPGVKNCTPVPSANPPRGFFLDRLSGDIVFTPTDCSEVGIVVIQIDEYRRDSATKKWELIGRTRRDMQLIVKNCGPNNPPEIKGANSYSVCEGDKLCFTMDGTDRQFTPHQTRPDTVQMRWNRGIPGATFEIKNPKDREKKAEFCWQTRIGQASDVFYTFTVTAQDDNCPRPATAIRGFRVKVKKKSIAERKYTNLSCGRFVYKSEPEKNFKGTPTYRWEIRDSLNSKLMFPISTRQSDTVKFIRGGKYIITHLINGPEDCPTIYTDTVIIPPVFEVSLGPDTFACYGERISISPKVENGRPQFKWSWSLYPQKDNDTNFSFSTQIFRDTLLSIRVTDADGCFDIDTLKIFSKSLPIANIRWLKRSDRICTYQQAVLSGAFPFKVNQFGRTDADSTLYYKWLPYGDTTHEITINVKGWYKLILKDKRWGCIAIDSVYQYVADTVTALAGTDRDLCNKDTLSLPSLGRHGDPMQKDPANDTRSYQWTDLSTNKIIGKFGKERGISVGKDSVVKIIPNQNNCYELLFRFSQGYANKFVVCEHRDTVCVKLIPLPDMSASVPARCYDYGDRNLGQESGLTSRHGTGVSFRSRTSPGIVILNGNTYLYKTTSIDNSTLQGGNFKRDVIISEFRDPKTGCYNKDSFLLITQGNPIVRLKDKIYCQDKGCSLMDSSIILPRVKTGAFYNWTVNRAPSGVDKNSLIRDLNQGTGLPPNYQFCFGDQTEDFYSGEYEMSFFIQDPITGCFTRDVTLINIVPEPKAEVKTLPQVCLNDDTVDLNLYVTLNGIPNPTDGRWVAISKDGDRFDSKLSNAVSQGRYFVPASGSGIWEFKYIHDATGCLTADSNTLIVKQLPLIRMPLDLKICSNESDINLKPDFVSPSGGTENWTGRGVYRTTWGGFWFPPKSDSIRTVNTYVMKYRYVDPFNCYNEDSMEITVQNLPEVDIITDPINICDDQFASLRSTYKWSNGIRWTSSGDGSFSTQDTSTQYTPGNLDKKLGFVKVYIQTQPISGNVCPNSVDSGDIFVHPYPEFDFTADTASGCQPVSIKMNLELLDSSISENNLTYLWEFGNGFNSSEKNPSNQFKYWGEYSVKLTVVNTTASCSTVLEKINYFDVWPKPKSNFSSTPEYYTTIAATRFQFKNNSTIDNGSMTYKWNFGTLNPMDTSREKDPQFIYGRDTGTYIVKMITISDKGCKDTSSKVVRIGPDIIVHIPNAFTPGEDGPFGNNVFKVWVENHTSFNLRIYNRWGEKLFETDDHNVGWNGKANGKYCQQGVYVYHVTVVSFEGKEYNYRGTVTLLK